MNSTSRQRPRLITTMFIGLLISFVSTLPLIVSAQSTSPSSNAAQHHHKINLPKAKSDEHPTAPQQEVRELRQK